MTVKRLNGKRRILKALMMNPYVDCSEFCKDNGASVVRGSLPKTVYRFYGNYQQCSCCGFYEKHGVKDRSGFICEKCFNDQFLFSPAKIIAKSGLHYCPKKSLENWCIEK